VRSTRLRRPGHCPERQVQYTFSTCRIASSYG
jgi:hypothetical protein